MKRFVRCAYCGCLLNADYDVIGISVQCSSCRQSFVAREYFLPTRSAELSSTRYRVVDPQRGATRKPARNTRCRETDSAPRGVGGWLLFLCIWTTIIAPLFSFAKLHEMEETEMYFGLGLIVFSTVSGILLWCGKPSGVVLVTTLFIVILVLNLGGMLVLARQQQTDKVPLLLFQSLVPAAWLVYLSVSKRVKATYYD